MMLNSLVQTPRLMIHEEGDGSICIREAEMCVFVGIELVSKAEAPS